MDHMSWKQELERGKIVAPSEKEGAGSLSTDEGEGTLSIDPAGALVPHGTDSSPNFGDKYVTLEKIGTGGMGAVYKVLDRELNQHFAIKVLQSELAKDSVALKRFEQEVESASKLSHPNLVAVYGYDRLPDGSPFLIMDFLDGKNLSQLIKESGSLNSEQALDVFLQIAQGLSHAHERGVVHRDIKPTNIIVSPGEDGRSTVKIVDFGIAKALPTANRETHNLTETGEVFGSPDYMSPEQCLGFMLDHRSDIYSLGCLMYEAITGNTPFAGANPIQLVVKHINEEVSEFSADLKRKKEIQKLENVVLRCLEKDQSNRYQSMDSLLNDLEAIKQGKQTSKYVRTKRAKPIFTTKAVLGLVIVVPVVLIYGMIAIFSTTDWSELTMRILMGVISAGLLVGAYIFFGMAQERYRKIDHWKVLEPEGWAALALGCLSVALVSIVPGTVALAIFAYRGPNELEPFLMVFLYNHIVFALLSVFAGVGCLLFRRKVVVSASNIMTKLLAITILLPVLTIILLPSVAGRVMCAAGQLPNKYCPEVSVSLVEYGANLSKSPRFFQEAADMALYKLDNKERAIADISKAIELEPTQNDLFFKRAAWYEKLGKYDLQLQDLNTYCGRVEQGLLERGSFYFKHGNLAKALDDYNESSERIKGQWKATPEEQKWLIRWVV